MTRSSRSGFTLIELLIVVLIIGVLVVVLVAVLFTARGRGDVAIAENFLDTTLKDAINRWQDDRGGLTTDFPPSGVNRPGEWFDGNTMLFEELVLKPEKAGRAPYITKDQMTRGKLPNGKEAFFDPWDKPYVYRNFSMKKAKDGSGYVYSGAKHNDSYDMISAGPDGKFDTDDDIWNGKS